MLHHRRSQQSRVGNSRACALQWWLFDGEALSFKLTEGVPKGAVALSGDRGSSGKAKALATGVGSDRGHELAKGDSDAIHGAGIGSQFVVTAAQVSG